MSNEEDQPVPLFDSDPKGDRPIISIYQGDISGDIHIMIDGMFVLIVDKPTIKRLNDGLNIAVKKLTPE